MRGQMSFDMLIALVILVNLLTMLGATVELISENAQKTVGYILCEWVEGSAARYYSFLLQNNLQLPSTQRISLSPVEVNVYYSAGSKRVVVTMNLGGVAISCEPRRVSP